ncbi:unnamed protein product [Angiostrongylus costaricensis]|uniref:Neuroblastoma-amplified sequence n=1 Tax=Angiostrongylus costaricensis TaxID=334426 RepID=A0A0R3PSJ5_ANGCS|nr:unnamed protein product [Angiostrongylus costaricensis]
MKRPRRCRYESEDAEENSKILLKEKYEMLRWTDTVEINTPNLLIPAQIANYVESLPFCKLAVSPSVNRFALMHHSRIMDVYAIDGQNIIQECSVQVLEDEFAQYCLLEFTASGSLLLSTRSTAQIDVFDHQGGYCYDISLVSGPPISLKLNIQKIISIYVNLLCPIFTRLSRFQRMWSVSLDIGLAGTFCVLPRYNLLLVSSHYRVSNDEGMPGGLCSFRLMNYEPFVEPIRLTIDQGGWLSRLPFSSANYAYLVSMTLNESLSKLAAVSGNGDFFLFDIPSTRILFSIKYISGPRPIQVVFTEDEEVAVLFHSGELVRSSLDQLRDSIHSLRNCEKSIFCPKLFVEETTFFLIPLQWKNMFLKEGTNALREAALQRTSLACRLWLYTLWRSLKKVTFSTSCCYIRPHELFRKQLVYLPRLLDQLLNEGDYSRAKSLAESYDTIDIDIVLKREWRDICHSQAITVESVDSILRQINDKDWIVEACISSDAPNLPVQKALVDLGTSFPNAALASQVRLHHNARILAVCECVNEYIEVRNLSCLSAAYRFAEVHFLLALGFYALTVDAEDFVTWVRERVRLIDSEAGLAEHCISLLNTSIQRGYETVLPGLLFLRLQVHMKSKDFQLPEEDIVRKLPEILSLLKWKTRDSSTSADDLRKTVLSFLLATSQHNVEVLQAIRNHVFLLVIQCLCCLELTGDALMRAVVSVGACPDLACSLSTLHSRGVKPTFKQLWESTSDADGARRLLIRMARCGQAASVAEWEALRDEVLDLTLRYLGITYGGLISPDEALSIVTREVLSDTRISHDRNVLKLFLTLDENENSGDVNRRLNIERSAEVLIAKSEELLQEAQSPSDTVLRQSRSMAEAAKTIAPIRAKKQLKFLDAVNLAHELGSTALPVAIKFAEPHVFLEEVVKLDGNYKQGRKCAELALLLGVETPVATALSLCALSALVANDERYLGKYIHEVMTKGHDLPVVHELCIRIMESPFVPAVCSSGDAAISLSYRLKSMRRPSRFCANALTFLPWRFVCAFAFLNVLVFPRVVPTSIFLFSSLQVATLLTNISAPLALCVAMSEAECRMWTKNDFLLKYEQALRFFEPQLTERLVESVSPSVLISQATMSDENITILDRLSHYGCDRERFVEDVDYRRETIMGLAMTDDDAVYADAIRLAADFKLDDWSIHFASLENALTSLSIPEAKALLKSRRHLARLRSDPERLYLQLRSSVAPLMTTNEQFIAYLTLFADGEPERASLPAIKRILEKKRDVKAFRLFTDADYLCNVIISMPDRAILSLEKELRYIPVEACEAAARILFDGNDLRPAANPAVIFALLSKDETNFIDLVATKDELIYLEKAVLMLEATPNVDNKLVSIVRG